jgi:hypothetical protein
MSGSQESGGAASLAQTRLWLHFPGNREFNRVEIAIGGLESGDSLAKPLIYWHYMPTQFSRYEFRTGN